MFLERDLLDSMPISSQCSKSETIVLRLLYESKLKKYHTTENILKDVLYSEVQNQRPMPEMIIPLSNRTPISSFTINTASTPVPEPTWTQTEEMPLTAVSKLQESLDLVVSNAERLYYNCEYQKCKQLTEEVLKKDPYHTDCLPVHIACLVELKESNSKF